MQAVQRAKDFYESHNKQGSERDTEKSIFIRADYSLIKITLAEIFFIEGLGDYLKIHLINKKTIVVRMTMKAMLEMLPESDFIRVHRSYIVPVSKVESIRNKTLRIGESVIPIGASYEENFMGRMAHR